MKKNSHSTRQWNVLPRRSLPPSARSIKVSARMSTSSADSPTACSDFRSNSTRRFSPSRESPDGVRTVWRKLKAAARSCVLPTKTSASIRFMSRWMSVSDFHSTPHSKKAARGLTERAGRSMWQYANLEPRPLQTEFSHHAYFPEYSILPAPSIRGQLF